MVLAVSPDSTTVVIADQVRQVIYLYTVSSAAHTSIGGLATRAQFSPDGQTLYVTGPNSLYIHNTNSGWSVYPNLPTQTGAGCNLNNNDYTSTTTPVHALLLPGHRSHHSRRRRLPDRPEPQHRLQLLPKYHDHPVYLLPQPRSRPGTVLPATDHITATTDRVHILGVNPTTLSDIYLGSVPAPPGFRSRTLPALQPAPAPSHREHLCRPALPNRAGPRPDSAGDRRIHRPGRRLARLDDRFCYLYRAHRHGSPLLPAYTLATTFGEAGTLSTVKLSGAATAPLAGAFSPDNTIFFVGTAGDNLVHFIDVPSLTDTKTINPGLVDPTGAPVPIQFLAVKPRPTT